MRTLGQAAVSGDEILHIDNLEPGDTDWLTYQPPGDSWAMNLTGVAKQALLPDDQTGAPEPDVASYQAAMRTRLNSVGLFFTEVSDLQPPPAKQATAPTPAPLDWPPGAAGQIARYVHGSAIRPVKEVAVIAALGLLAGICGRQWQIPKSGLNLYIVLIARSAIGKEAMHSGISEILAACEKEHPAAGKFVDFTEYASGPALIKGCAANTCFVNVSGELGRRFKRLTAEGGRDSALHTWRTQLTNLYQKSFAKSITGGLSYSNTESNIQSITGVAYSLIGETTPGTFLESLTSDMMEDGFMSRFTMIEYSGERPEKNYSVSDTPPKSLVRTVLDLMGQADQNAAKGLFISVQRSPAAGVRLDLFEEECDRRINAAGSNESRRQMWNRAHLKALRIAALLAVADNHMWPVITQAHADWAINLILRDIAAFTKRLDSGDIGDGDDAREAKLVAVMRDYLLNPVAASYKVHPDMQKNSIVPLHYLQKRTATSAAFYNHKLKASRALQETLASLIAQGYLMEVQRDKVIDAYNYHGKGYRILKLPEQNN